MQYDTPSSRANKTQLPGLNVAVIAGMGVYLLISLTLAVALGNPNCNNTKVTNALTLCDANPVLCPVGGPCCDTNVCNDCVQYFYHTGADPNMYPQACLGGNPNFFCRLQYIDCYNISICFYDTNTDSCIRGATCGYVVGANVATDDGAPCVPVPPGM